MITVQQHQMRLYYRWFLVLLAIVTVVILLRTYSETEELDDEFVNQLAVPTFKWVDLKGYKKCRNSAQGSKIIVDDRGYICDWSDRLSSGCCFPKGISAKKFACDSCLAHRCCSVYEHCVSCCLHPDKQTLVQTILANNSRGILTKVADQFEFCLVKCRTSSESVIHENHYRNSKYKHCYGAKHP